MHKYDRVDEGVPLKQGLKHHYRYDILLRITVDEGVPLKQGLKPNI